MKNKIIRKFFYAGLISASMLSFHACSEDYLDLKPEGRPTLGEVPIGGFEAQAFGLYSSLRTEGGVSNFDYLWTHIIRADDNEKGSTPSDAATNGNVFDNFNYVASNGTIAADWNGHYKIIFDSNELINDAVASGDTSQGTLVNIAEAKAIRAFCYFELRRDFGEVPIILKTIDDIKDEVAPKNTIAEVEAQIEKDLTEAAAQLPVQWPSTYLGRSTKGFANTLLGKLYVYQKQWAKAQTKLNEVMASGIYQLNPSYAAEFSQAGNNSKESIFEIQVTYDFATKYYNNFYESQGVRGSGSWDLGWGFNVPSQGLVDAYETGDIRKKTTILESGKPDIYDQATLPQYPTVAVQKYWNGKAYTHPSERAKYNTNKNWWEDIKLIRYADVILLSAEAANELGQTAEAARLVNMIRTRAKLPPTTAASQSELRAAIKHERRIEFAMEFERFYDLVRWGDAITALAHKGYQDRNKYFPIPQSAIDKSQGVLKQNPDY